MKTMKKFKQLDEDIIILELKKNLMFNPDIITIQERMLNLISKGFLWKTDK